MRPLLALCALVLLLPGCGGSDPVEAAGGTVRLRIDEYRILPREIHVSGSHVRIVMTDAGTLPHTAKVFSTREFDAEDKPIQIGDGTPTAHPGETVTSKVLTLEPGRYRLARSIAKHPHPREHAVLVIGRS